MSEGVTLNSGVADASFAAAADLIGGFYHQRVKVSHGVDGAAVDASAVDPLPTRHAATAATVASVAAATVTTVLLAANAARRGYKLFNASTAVLYVKEGAAGDATSYSFQVPAGGFYESGSVAYTGAVSGAWAAANGTVKTTELT